MKMIDIIESDEFVKCFDETVSEIAKNRTPYGKFKRNAFDALTESKMILNPTRYRAEIYACARGDCNLPSTQRAMLQHLTILAAARCVAASNKKETTD